MGFFSWKTADTGETIWNKHNRRGPTPCKMLTPDKPPRVERDYNGYGDFGGVDFYAEVDRLNGGTGDRDRGITLAHSREPGGGQVVKPRLVSIDFQGEWGDVSDSADCPTQGYFG